MDRGEVTALTDVPERMVVLGGGPRSASKCPQAVHRMERRSHSSRAAITSCRASRSRWARRSAKPSTRRASSCARTARVGGAGRRRRACSSSRSATSGVGTGCWSRRAQAPHRRARPRHGRDRARQARDRGRRADVGRRGRAIGDVTGIWPLTYVGKYQARRARRTSSGARRRPTTMPSRACSPIPRPHRSGTQRLVSATVLISEVPRTATYTREYAESPGFMTLISDGSGSPAPTRSAPTPGEWLQQATVAIRRDPARRAARHDPAVPDLLRDLPTRVPAAWRSSARSHV